jgi:hypothetical protein
MSGAANQGVFGQGPNWMRDDRAYALWHLSRPLLVAGAIIGFALWWPIGLVCLVFAIWNRRCGRLLFGMEPGGGQGFRGGCWGGGPAGSWGRRGRGGRSGGNGGSSGNQAFDDYRAATLRRLEEEQAEFTSFLDRLRFAKDKAEFDQFMAERRARPEAGDNSEPSGQN